MDVRGKDSPSLRKDCVQGWKGKKAIVAAMVGEGGRVGYTARREGRGLRPAFLVLQELGL